MSDKDTQQEIASQVEAEARDATPEKRERRRDKRSAAYKIASIATFCAIAVVCKLIGRTLMLTPSFTISFIYLPWLIAGATLGPVGGMTVGLISDLLGNVIFVTQAFNPLTLLSNTLFPLPIALIFKLSKRGNVYVKTVCGTLISLAACTLGLGSFALYWYYGYIGSIDFFTYLWIYRMPQVGVLAVNIVVLCILVRPLQRVRMYPVSEDEGSGLFAPVSGLCVSAALYITAMILISVNGFGTARAYVILTAVWLLISMLSVSPLTRGKAKTALIIGETLAALATALAATIRNGNVQPWLEYILTAAAVIAAAAVIVAVIVVRTKKSRRKDT